MLHPVLSIEADDQSVILEAIVCVVAGHVLKRKHLVVHDHGRVVPEPFSLHQRFPIDALDHGRVRVLFID